MQLLNEIVLLSLFGVVAKTHFTLDEIYTKGSFSMAVDNKSEINREGTIMIVLLSIFLLINSFVSIVGFI